jgi:hypothetical protein
MRDAALPPLHAVRPAPRGVRGAGGVLENFERTGSQEGSSPGNFPACANRKTTGVAHHKPLCRQNISGLQCSGGLPKRDGDVSE